MKILTLVLVFLSVQFNSFAHQDTHLEVESNGKLIGLPEKYSIAHFERSTFTLTINDRQIVIPECVKQYFKDYQNYAIVFSASWYHDPELLPYYIHIDIITFENPRGCQIFFNLETLEIFQILKPEIIFSEEGPNRYLFNEQEIFVECQKEISNSITKK